MCSGHRGEAGYEMGDIPRGALPADQAAFLLEARRKRGKRMVLGNSVNVSACQTLQRPQKALRPQDGEPVVEVIVSFARLDGRLFLQEDVSRVDAFVHLHDGNACLFLTPDERPVHGCGSPVLWQQRGVDIDATHGRSVDDLLRQDLAEGDKDHHVGGKPAEDLEELGGPDLFGLMDGQPVPHGRLLHRRGDEALPSPLGPVGLRDDADNGPGLLDKELQGRDREFRSSHEQDAGLVSAHVHLGCVILAAFNDGWQ